MTTSTDTKRITYPISPEYVKTWTTERAISELVANAYDEDRDFTFNYENKKLIIEDNGPGIQESGMILGISNKNVQQIGTHGEGKKIGSLVLCRAGIDVLFETVGYSFKPLLVTENFIESGAGVEVLAYDFYQSDRQKGTKVTISCSQKMAEKVKSRFLFLSSNDYAQPLGVGNIAGEEGKLYIGGVFIHKNPNLHFSYNFSLEAAKHLSNRDRTEISGWKIDNLCTQVRNESTDKEFILKWAKMSLAGELDGKESQSNQLSPFLRKTLYENREQILPSPKSYYIDRNDDPETALELQDRGYSELTVKGNIYKMNGLLRALEVPSASSLEKRVSKKSESTTDWISIDDIEKEEKENLQRAIRIVRGLWGQEAIANYGVFTRTGILENYNVAKGFYQPTGKGKIGISKSILNNFDETLSVVTHEAAHRLRHKLGYSDYQDRTRGFQRQLQEMAASAAKLLDEKNSIPEPVSALVNARSHVYSNENVKAFVSDKAAAVGIKSAADLARKTGISAGSARKILAGKAEINSENVKSVADLFEVNKHAFTLIFIMLKSKSFRKKKDGSVSGPGGVFLRREVEVLKEKPGFKRIAKNIQDLYLGGDFTDPKIWIPYVDQLIDILKK